MGLSIRLMVCLFIEITSAIKSSVCTYSVCKEELDQPGYIVTLPSSKSSGSGQAQREVVICVSCARSMRGRYKLIKLPDNTDFACAVGSSKSNVAHYSLIMHVNFGCQC